MHDVPHVYFIQKQKMAMDYEKKQQQSKGQMQLPAADTPEGRALAEQQERILDFINSESGREITQRIAGKIRTAQVALGATATDWDAKRCADYFTQFSTNPIVTELQDCGGDMLQRITTFDNISDEGITEIMTMQAVFSRDARSGGTLISKLRSDPSAMGVASAMQSVSAMLKLGAVGQGEKIQLPASMLGVQAAPMSHDHSHGHSHEHEHVHGPNCNHGPQKEKAPDVSSGKVDRIER